MNQNQRDHGEIKEMVLRVEAKLDDFQGRVSALEAKGQMTERLLIGAALSIFGLVTAWLVSALN